MNYIISQLGYSISSTELDTTIDKIINDKSSSVYKAITSDNFTYSFNTKDTIDAFIKDIDTYLADKNNNPSLKSYSSNEVQKARFGDLINNETYFTNDGNSYKLNIELLNDKNNAPVDVKAYIQNGGRITDLESLRKAIAFCTTISDKSSNVGGVKGTRTGKFINEYLNDGNKPFNTNFIINSDWTISFTGDVTLISKNEANNAFADLKDALINTYSAELTAVFGNDTQAKTNLFNIAMYRILSSMTMTTNTKLNDVMKKVMTEFKNLLDKSAKDTTGKCKDYVAGYHNSGLLQGANLTNMWPYYT